MTTTMTAKERAQEKAASEGRPFEIISDMKVAFTREFAEKYCELPKFEGERSVSHDRAEKLRALMHDGGWNEGQGEISIAVFPDGTEYRVNGQHRCFARFMLEDDSFCPKIRVVKYRVKDADEYRRLYVSVDNPDFVKVRSRGHLVAMSLFGTEEFTGITKHACLAAEQGFRGWQLGFNNQTRKATLQSVVEQMRGEFNHKAREVAEILQPIVNDRKKYGHMQRAPVYASVWETMKYPTQSKEFWKKVTEGLFTEKTDPCKILADYLHRTGLGFKKRGRSVTQIANQDEMYAACVKTFNFFKAGKGLEKMPPTVGARPVAK